MLIDGAFTSGFDQTLPLFVGLAWLAFLTVGVALTYHRAVRPSATRRLEVPGRHLDDAAARRQSGQVT